MNDIQNAVAKLTAARSAHARTTRRERFARRRTGALRDPKGCRTRPWLSFVHPLAGKCDGVHPPDATGPCAFCTIDRGDRS